MSRSLATDRALDSRRHSPATGAMAVHTAREGERVHASKDTVDRCDVKYRAQAAARASEAMVSGPGDDLGRTPGGMGPFASGQGPVRRPRSAVGGRLTRGPHAGRRDRAEPLARPTRMMRPMRARVIWATVEGRR